jgi:hypothetical protein
MKVVRVSAVRTGRLYTPRIYSYYSFLLEAESSHWHDPSGHSAAGRIMSMKNSNDAIEPATFRLVAQCLNQLRHRVPPCFVDACLMANLSKESFPVSVQGNDVWCAFSTFQIFQSAWQDQQELLIIYYEWKFRRTYSRKVPINFIMAICPSMFLRLSVGLQLYGFSWNLVLDFSLKRLRWSRGSVLAFGNKVRGFKPGRSRRIFRTKKSSARLPSEGK